ncbi:hypothetical protein PFICI_01113 [Pestalotiopsis fici W106-1]|uniref:Sphingolipid long chain base-responsive protein LSP1 n=1 Tax=Pestalotiopsis fici (strain W106-1 / CGMCC3.15140) TaxID=1229662 RepID=W3XMX7_PESFW|nr:uncharacterized protein PFICI_01113 [Pestalotiopsis fici W106-1]ETS87285.1 hypothetical protein PFICI_01113 [Pestalotiopsis fici W106-1]
MANPKACVRSRFSSLLLDADAPVQSSFDLDAEQRSIRFATSPGAHAIETIDVLKQSQQSTSSESNATDTSAGSRRYLGHAPQNTKTSKVSYPYLPASWLFRNRALSIRSKGSKNDGGSSRRPFSFGSLRGNMQPELSRKLYKVIKSSNNLITAHDAAAKERNTIANQLSEWGEQTQDEAVSDISDKVGVILSELGVQEDNYAQNLEESRGVLKAIRNTEKSVQPSRDNKAKIADEIQKLKMKEPQSTRLVVLEQELVRAEAENLVAEAQLSNITRQKIKQAYDIEFAAVIERAERQIILAKHGRRLLSLLDDTPMTPGDAQREYQSGSEARQILNDAEDDLRNWEPHPNDEPFHDAPDAAAADYTTEPSTAPLSDSTVSAGEAQPTTKATPSASVAA